MGSFSRAWGCVVFQIRALRRRYGDNVYQVPEPELVRLLKVAAEPYLDSHHGVYPGSQAGRASPQILGGGFGFVRARGM